MRLKYEKFWKDHVLGRKEPKPQKYEDIRRLIKQPVGTIVAPDQIIRWAHEYKQIGRELGENGNLNQRKKQLRVELLDWMRKQDDFIIDDDCTDKWVLRDTMGKKLISYNGKVFR
jgi:hypothetical protein